MTKWRIAIAGLGAAAKTIHLPAFAKLHDVEVVGGTDPVAVPTEVGFPLFDDVETMLRDLAPDILVVVTPPDSHCDLTLCGLAHGAHVFCEKPFVNTLDEGRQILAAARQAGRQVFVNNQFRFMDIHQAAKRRMADADFGRLLFLSMYQSFFVTDETEAGWRGADPRRTCKEFGTHVLDLCRFFFDEEPRALAARMPRPDRFEGPDYLNLLQLEFSGDRVASITLNRLSRGPHSYLDTRLDGSEGCIMASIGGRAQATIGIRGGSRRPFADVDLSLGGHARIFHGDKSRKLAADPLDLFPNATALLVRTALDRLRRGELPPCHAADNLKTLELMLSAYEASEGTGHLTLPEPEPATASTEGVSN
ncbi:MAG: Gfo/Idh/MocA family oxidoreductase [Alphaproteobacteria bacterium]